MLHTCRPKGVCSRRFAIEIEDGIVRSLEVEGGCDGNSKGIARLVQGRSADELIGLLEGITCEGKPTSCPDQLSKALREITANL
ncbi:MAG: TIGR03905 family TSCPD domain-containing protein [Oscillospiraceae bacterium]